jgi:hypothetical protein
MRIDPRAVPYSVAHSIILPFFLACCAVGLLLALSEWAMRVLPEVLR